MGNAEEAMRGEEDTLSDKIIWFEKNLNTGEKLEMMYAKDVKEFIKKLKELLNPLRCGIKVVAHDRVIGQINKLAGDKLIWKGIIK